MVTMLIHTKDISTSLSFSLRVILRNFKDNTIVAHYTLVPNFNNLDSIHGKTQ